MIENLLPICLLPFLKYYLYFFRIYPDKEPSVTLKSSKSVGSVGNTTLEMLKNPEDLLKLVNWHSQEIHQQNQQINQLLEEKKRTQEQFQRLQGLPFTSDLKRILLKETSKDKDEF